MFPSHENTELRLGLPFEAKLASSGADVGLIAGYAATFGGTPDSYGDVIAPGAFQETLADAKASGNLPLMLWSHHTSEPIGVWDDMHEDKTGLSVSGRINLDTQRGREALALIKQGAISGLSIGYSVGGGGRRRNPDGSYTIVSVKLWEVSVVAVPANRNARIVSAKSVQSRPDFERFLKSAGFANGAAKKLSTGWAALAGSDDVSDLAAKIQSATAELKSMKE